MPNRKAPAVRVGSEWITCPYCFCSYHHPDSHHPACPIFLSDSLCRFCGTPHSRSHDPGCPHSTGLFPILYREVAAQLTCAECSYLFQLGDCFVAGNTAILCVGCGWEEPETP